MDTLPLFSPEADRFCHLEFQDFEEFDLWPIFNDDCLAGDFRYDLVLKVPCLEIWSNYSFITVFKPWMRPSYSEILFFCFTILVLKDLLRSSNLFSSLAIDSLSPLSSPKSLEISI